MKEEIEKSEYDQLIEYDKQKYYTSLIEVIDEKIGELKGELDALHSRHETKKDTLWCAKNDLELLGPRGKNYETMVWAMNKVERVESEIDSTRSEIYLLDERIGCIIYQRNLFVTKY